VLTFQRHWVRQSARAKKGPREKMNFAEGLDPLIFFREEKNEQVPVRIIRDWLQTSVRYRTLVAIARR
jgi:hypothetical protein